MILSIVFSYMTIVAAIIFFLKYATKRQKTKLGQHDVGIIVNKKEKAEFVYSREINVFLLMIIIFFACTAFVLGAFIFTFDNLKQPEYKKLEKQLEKEWKHNAEDTLR